MKFFVGTYTSMGGPGLCLMEARDGRLTMLGSCRVIANPIYLTLSANRTALYAAAALGPNLKGAAASFRVEGDRFAPLCIQPAGGDEACHAVLSPEEDFLYTANYNSGSVTAFPVHDGYVFPRQQLLRHKGASGAVPARQEAPHPHQCAFRPETSELFVCDLGKDEIFIYGQGEESGLIIHTGTIPAPAGCGPRHLLFVSRDCFLLAGELSSTVMRFVCRDGQWALAETLSTLPADCATENTAAAIRRFGSRVYVSNRGHNSIAVFHMEKDGSLRPEAFQPIRGDFPRDILVFGQGDILCANQKSGTVEWISGGKTIAEAPVPAAVSLVALDAPC